MKKILLLLIGLFAFTPTAFALSKVNRMDINIEIDSEGIATIEEKWMIPEQNNNYFEKNFYDVNGVTISDIELSDSISSSYLYIDKFDKKRSLIYNFQDKGKTKKIRVLTNNKDTTLSIKYKVNGIITKYEDLYAINWNILSSTPSFEIGTLNTYISGPIEFNETNMALYGIGNNISCEFENGKIHLFSSNIPSKTKIKLMASLANYKFPNHLDSTETFQKAYDDYKSRTPLHSYIEQILDNILITTLIILTILFLIIILIFKLMKKDKISKDFKSIKPYKKSKIVGELSSVPYVDEIPCDFDLYKMYFIANYYSIIKHRSSLVGAVLFKLILEGHITIESNEDAFYLSLKSDAKIIDKLDNELYQILIAASNNLILDGNKLIRYAKDHSSEFINWFDSAVAYAIKDEYIKRNISVKGNKIMLNKVIYNEAVSIQGFKRYLLNFNQVPRKTELTEERYKYSLISSILLRVDENFYKELLRKNPDNDGALSLEEFSKVKYIYSNIYSECIEEFSKNKKNKRSKYRYNPLKNKM